MDNLSTHLAFAFLRGLGSSTQKSRLIEGILGYLPSFEGHGGRGVAGSTTSTNRAFGEVSTSIAEQILATRSTSDAIGTRADVRDATSLEGGSCGASNLAAWVARPQEESDFPPLGGTRCQANTLEAPHVSHLRPLFILLEFKHLQCTLAILLLTCFWFIVGNLRSTKVIFEVLYRLFKYVSFGPQGSFRPLRMLTHPLKGLLSSQQCRPPLPQLGVQHLRTYLP